MVVLNCVALLPKYGNENFWIEPLAQCINQESADITETAIILQYNCIVDGYNLKTSGSCGILSEETRRKISKAGTGRKHSIETRKKMSEWQIGKIVSEESKNKNRAAHLGKILSQETKNKIGISSKGRKHSPETKKKMSESKKGNTYNLGRRPSEETKKKMSESAIILHRQKRIKSCE